MRMFSIGAEVTTEVERALEEISENSTVRVSQLVFGRDFEGLHSTDSRSGKGRGANQLLAVKDTADAFYRSSLRGEQDYRLL